jgi:hypothetical protein
MVLPVKTNAVSAHFSNAPLPFLSMQGRRSLPLRQSKRRKVERYLLKKYRRRITVLAIKLPLVDATL